MMFELFMLALLLGVAFAGYDDTVEEKKEKGKWAEEETAEEEAEVEDKPKPQHYDEVYAAGYKGQLYGASALYGDSDWQEWKLNVGHELYQPAGIALCNTKVDKWELWSTVYVADAGDAKHPGAVYQYEVVRDEHNPGHYELENKKVIYGGEEMVGMDEVYEWQKKAKVDDKKAEAPAAEAVVEAEVEDHAPPAPVDVICDSASGGVFIADNNHGQVVWNGKARSNDNEAWVNQECENAVKGVQAGKKVDQWVYWATNNVEAPEASGVYRQDVTNGQVKCHEAIMENDWLEKGAAVEKVVAHDDGVWGVAIHNDKVLLAQEGEIYSAGDVGSHGEVERWSWGHGNVRKVASAADRGVVYADEEEGGVYVTKGGNKHNKVADVPAAYGVDYYAGQEWVKEEDSANAVVLSVVALVAAVAAL